MRREVRAVEDVEAVVQQWRPAGGSPEPAREDGLKIQSVSDLESIRTFANQRIDYLVQGLFAHGTVNLISGDSGCGKSTVAMAMCSAIERAALFAGLATQRRPCLVLDRENPLSVVIERCDRLGISDSPNFKIWGGWCPEEAPSPFSPIITRWVEACSPKPVILIDSFVAFLEGDENDATAVRAYMQGFRRLADQGATILILHHSGKAETSKDYRGSSDIKASCDVAFHLANMGDSSRLGTLRLRAFKARFTVEPELILNYFDGEFRADTRAPVLTVTEKLGIS